MNPSPYQPWVNLLTLLPGTSLTLLTIAVAFLRFYNEQDFHFLGYLTEPRVWSNRLTVAALVVAVVNFGVEWNLRGCLKSQREPQTIPVESDNLRRIQYFVSLLATNYTWGNPFQTTS